MSGFRDAFRVMNVFCAILICAVICRAEPPSTAPAGDPALRVEFLTLDQARAAIVDDSAEPYFSLLNEREMSVKTGRAIAGDTLDEQRAECKKRYQQACEAFTDDEQAAMKQILEQIQPAIARDFPAFAAQPWSFLKVNPSLEGGMSHTRGGHIVLAGPRVARFRATLKMGRPAILMAANTLVHEQTHVVERAHPEWFIPLYTDVLGFRRAKSIASDPWLDARQLINPDGAKKDWVFPINSNGQTQWIWPMIMFAEEHGDSFRDIRMAGVDLDPDGPDRFKVKLGNDGAPITRSLSAIPDYIRAVQTRQNDYHPNEVAADLMARLVADSLSDKPPTTNPARNGPTTAQASFDRVRRWARETFKPAPN